MAADFRLRDAGPSILTVVFLSPVAVILFQLGIPIEVLVFGLLFGGYKAPRLVESYRAGNSPASEDSKEGGQAESSDAQSSQTEDTAKASSSSSLPWRAKFGSWRSRTTDSKDGKKKEKDDFLTWRKGSADAKAKKKSAAEEKKEASRSVLSALKKNPTQTQWRSIINKFTPEKFDKLCEQLLATLPANEAERTTTVDEYRQVLDDLLALIFEASSRQHNYTEMYTELCKKLLEYVAKQQPDLDGKGCIWEKCQHIFLNTVLKTPEFPADLPEDELMDRKAKHKEKMVGMVKFGGDLVAHGLVPGDGVMQWIHTLLSEKCQEFYGEEDLSPVRHSPPDGDSFEQRQDKDVEQREVQLEVLCAILASMGSSLSDSNTWSEENRSVIEDVFDQLQSLAMDGNLSLRIRCLIRDILDLRMAQWKEKEGKLKPSVLEKRRKDGEDECESQLREDAPEFVPGSGSWKSDRVDMGRAWLDPQLLASLQAVEHHLEVIEDKDAKLQRLKALIQLNVLIHQKQMAVVANSGNVKRCMELIAESFEEIDVRSLDLSMAEEVRKENLRGFDTGEVGVLVMASEVSTRKDFELSKPIAVLVNFDFPMTMQLYLYRIYKRACTDPANGGSSTHVYTFFSPATDIRHTTSLIVTMEAAKHKVPPALHKLKEQVKSEPAPKRDTRPDRRNPKGGEGRLEQDESSSRNRWDDKEAGWKHREPRRGSDGTQDDRWEDRAEEAGENHKGSGKGKPRWRGDSRRDLEPKDSTSGGASGSSSSRAIGEAQPRRREQARRGEDGHEASSPRGGPGEGKGEGKGRGGHKGGRPVGGRGSRDGGGQHGDRHAEDGPQRFEILQRSQSDGQRNDRAPWSENDSHREAGRNSDYGNPESAGDERIKAGSSPALGPTDRGTPGGKGRRFELGKGQSDQSSHGQQKGKETRGAI
mmetsp:Transcript_2427/g.5192  ORF Transcript_2427/g.5192 Transcript_2427/m.5192 type:complete len:928 (+) Transcript_2427:35-2818(+)